MPTYFYVCDECGDAQEVFHSMRERLEDCSACNVSGSLRRVPQSHYVTTKTTTGQVVKDFIDEAKRDLAAQQRDAGGREYKP